jgi:hypothetical protein
MGERRNAYNNLEERRPLGGTGQSLKRIGRGTRRQGYVLEEIFRLN